MKKDSLKINQNKDGSFSVEWDKKDLIGNGMNNLTTKELQVMIQQSIKYDQTNVSR